MKRSSIRFRKIIRGASMVEYALLLVTVLVVAAAGYKALGGKVQTATDNAGSKLGG